MNIDEKLDLIPEIYENQQKILDLLDSLGIQPGSRALEKRLVTRHEAADLLGVSLPTIDRLAASGALPKRKAGTAVRFYEDDLYTYLESR